MTLAAGTTYRYVGLPGEPDPIVDGLRVERTWHGGTRIECRALSLETGEDMDLPIVIDAADLVAAINQGWLIPVTINHDQCPMGDDQPVETIGVGTVERVTVEHDYLRLVVYVRDAPEVKPPSALLGQRVELIAIPDTIELIQ